MSAKTAPLARGRRFYQRYAPFIALAIGCATRVWSHHGVDFAPKAVALVALAWMLPFALARWTSRAAAEGRRTAARRSCSAWPSWAARRW